MDNKGIFIGLGLFGLLILSTLDSGEKQKPKAEPENKPKKVIM